MNLNYYIKIRKMEMVSIYEEDLYEKATTKKFSESSANGSLGYCVCTRDNVIGAREKYIGGIGSSYSGG